jgi:hypothetical protein
VENLKAAGATRINSRVNGEQRPNGLIDFMQFYDLLPTPVVVDNPHPNSKVNENGRRYNNKEESSHSMGLADRAQHGLLPTPTAIEGVKWTNTWNPNSQMGQSLSAMAGSGMLPTPTASLEKQSHSNLENINPRQKWNLYEVIAEEVQTIQKKSPDADAGHNSRLSPLFTEEMMGFPLMWTALPFLSENGEPKPSKPTATPSSPK